MILRWFYVAFLVAHIASARAELRTCPESCDHADAWCSEVFGSGGALSSQNCRTNSFECTCNSASSILIQSNASDFNGKCTWNDAFEPTGIRGTMCHSDTSLCPSDCDVDGPWLELCVDDIYCADHPSGAGVVFNCTTCEGRTFSMTGGGDTVCKRSLSSPIACQTQTTCNGHGCCRRPDKVTDEDGACVCHANDEDGYWGPPSCAACYESDKVELDDKCIPKKPNIQIFFSSIANRWTMVVPNMAVLFFYLIIGISRRVSKSDKCFQSSILRMTGLSTVQVARRHQRSVFRSKYIPKRSAQSRCFLNKDSEHRRGPPPY